MKKRILKKELNFNGGAAERKPGEKEKKKRKKKEKKRKKNISNLP